MITAICIQKFKKNNKIYGYRLQDEQGNTKDISSDQLKSAIRSQKIVITNLTLTSDNRLVDSASTQKTNTQMVSEREQKIKNIMHKAKLLNVPIKEIPTACGHKCYLISVSTDNYIVYIPEDVTRLNESDEYLPFTEYIRLLNGKVEIAGGKNLTDASYMFNECMAKSLDLSTFNTSNITNMESMFAFCRTLSLDLSLFDTRKVVNMDSMFAFCWAKNLDLSSFDTSNVENMQYMFTECQAKSINLKSFNTSKVTNMSNMFAFCMTESLDLSSFNISSAEDISNMFKCCKAQDINLSSFDTSNVGNMIDIFTGYNGWIEANDSNILDKYEKAKKAKHPIYYSTL